MVLGVRRTLERWRPQSLQFFRLVPLAFSPHLAWPALPPPSPPVSFRHDVYQGTTSDAENQGRSVPLWVGLFLRSGALRDVVSLLHSIHGIPCCGVGPERRNNDRDAIPPRHHRQGWNRVSDRWQGVILPVPVSICALESVLLSLYYLGCTRSVKKGSVSTGSQECAQRSYTESS
jgi:hypothetical protein